MFKQTKGNEGFKLPRIEKTHTYVLQSNRDSIDFLLGKNKNDIAPLLRPEKKLTTELLTNRLARRGSQILDNSSQVFMPIQQTQRKISQMECKYDIQNFFTLEPTQEIKKPIVVTKINRVPKHYRLQNFTDWVEKLYGQDWFNDQI
ncbi:unnamed protein product [Paramecium sonneborni]|uniref:Uncharacterized protein n=1 Tax=Paramecium sonneborni TaxID=65129 RepID=A0A8S1RM22_9CILI|nr:unnamed protein product [Paramecium sonneborni]